MRAPRLRWTLIFALGAAAPMPTGFPPQDSPPQPRQVGPIEPLPAEAGGALAGNIQMLRTPTTTYCVIPERRFCRYDPPGQRGAPCQCGGVAGRFAS